LVDHFEYIFYGYFSFSFSQLQAYPVWKDKKIGDLDVSRADEFYIQMVIDTTSTPTKTI